MGGQVTSTSLRDSGTCLPAPRRLKMATPLQMPDVWAEDRVATAAIARNREAHKQCVPVAVLPACAPCRPVALFLDSGIMAAHQPPPREAWEQADAAGAYDTVSYHDIADRVIFIANRVRCNRAAAWSPQHVSSSNILEREARADRGGDLIFAGLGYRRAVQGHARAPRHGRRAHEGT